jgi:hypothetical protein
LRPNISIFPRPHPQYLDDKTTPPHFFQQAHVTALPSGFGQHLDDGLAEAGVVVGDHELDA